MNNDKPKSKYSIIEYDWGFTIWRDDKRIDIILHSDRFSFRIEHSPYLDPDADVCVLRKKLLTQRIAMHFSSIWKVKPGGEYGTNAALREWSRVNITKALSKRIGMQVDRLLDLRYTPFQIRVMKRVYQATSLLPGNLYFDILELPEMEYFVRDLFKYRAAAQFLFLLGEQDTPNTIQEMTILMLQDWRDELNNGQSPSKSFNITLDNWPNAMSVSLLPYLHLANLRKPITNRRELIGTLLVCKEIVPAETYAMEVWRKIAQYHTAQDWKEAMGIYNDIFVAMSFSPNKTKDIQLLVVYIRDSFALKANFPQIETPLLPGMKLQNLVRNSHAVHTEQHERGLYHGNYERQKLHPLDETKKPPIELPIFEDGSIVFLDTVKSIWIEGEMMRHCVGTYAHGAVNGNSYLFHIEYKGHVATAELDSSGRVVAAHGIENEQNVACEWGKRILEKWSWYIDKGYSTMAFLNPPPS